MNETTCWKCSQQRPNTQSACPNCQAWITPPDTGTVSRRAFNVSSLVVMLLVLLAAWLVLHGLGAV
jgi:predicted ATP-dependent serine protease